MIREEDHNQCLFLITNQLQEVCIILNINQLLGETPFCGIGHTLVSKVLVRNGEDIRSS